MTRGAVPYDVIVIGGGVIGCAAAYYLSRKKLKTLVVERADQAAGSAGATDGVVGYHTKKPGVHMEFAILSISMFPSLSAELDADVEYDAKCGGMLLIENEAQWGVMEELASEQRAGGIDIRMIGVRQARELEPQLSPRLRGALYSPDGGKVNPMKLTFAYAAAAKRAGAVFLNGTAVCGIIKNSGGIIGIKTAAGDYICDNIIIAAGSWSAAVGEMAGIDLPIRPRKGQLIVTEPIGPFIRATMQCAGYYMVKNKPDSVTDEYTLRTGASFGIAQSADGAVLIGSTRELAGYDAENTLESFEAILRRSADFFPALSKVHAIRSFAGFRPYAPDGLPMIGAAGAVRGLYIAAGHEGDGIALAPATGKLISEAIADGAPSFSLDAFDPNRFSRVPRLADTWR